MNVTASVSFNRCGPKMFVQRKPPAFLSARGAPPTLALAGDSRSLGPQALRQISGSSTFRRIHKVRSAGRMPTKNTPRQPHRGMISQRHDGGRAVADRPRALHEPERLAAMLGRPRLGHERRAAGPLPAEAEAEQDAEDRKLGHVLRETARRGEDRVDQHARHERARPAVAIGDDTEDHPAGGGRDERGGAEQAGGLLGHAQLGDDRREDERSRASRRTSRASSPSEAAMSARRAAGEPCATSQTPRVRPAGWLGANGAHRQPGRFEPFCAAVGSTRASLACRRGCRSSRRASGCRGRPRR